MSNWVNFRLNVLAGSPAEINQVAADLQKPCADLLAWVAGRLGETPEAIADSLKQLVSFKAVRNLDMMDPTVNKARQFDNYFNFISWGTVMSHICFVSEHFPSAIFLLEYWDYQASYEGKIVIHGGENVQQIHDGNQQDQAREWVLPNIFAPYWTEYSLGAQFGSLWGEWVKELEAAVEELKATASILPPSNRP